MKNTKTRHQCLQCKVIITWGEALKAQNPFDKDYIIYGCPKCFTVDDFILSCGVLTCNEPALCGTQTKSGYSLTCLQHQPLAEAERMTNEEETEVTNKARVIHASGQGTPHPFKGGTLCGKMVRLGGLEFPGRPATCKTCLKIAPLAKEFNEICQRVQDIMQWDIYKADTWMKTLNPFLGDISPIEMIRLGRGHRVMSFIDGVVREQSE